METVTTIAALIVVGIVGALLAKRYNKEAEIMDLETKLAIKHAEAQQKQENYGNAKKAFKDKFGNITDGSNDGKGTGL